MTATSYPKTITAPIPFHKVVGAGNDFVVLMLSDKNCLQIYESDSRSLYIEKLCDRTNGIGADGLIFIEREGGERFHWKFFNRDGSAAELCGNAARAVTRLLIEIYEISEVSVKTLEGNFVGSIVGDRISVEFDMKIEHRDITLEVAGSHTSGVWIKAGVPHFVPHQQMTWDEARRWKPHLPALRHAKEHGPAGANITMIDHEFKAITFERGVEDFTLACGTGAIAAAWFITNRGGAMDPVRIEMPGGALEVQFLKNNIVRLVGEGRYLFSGLYRVNKEDIEHA